MEKQPTCEEFDLGCLGLILTFFFSLFIWISFCIIPTKEDQEITWGKYYNLQSIEWPPTLHPPPLPLLPRHLSLPPPLQLSPSLPWLAHPVRHPHQRCSSSFCEEYAWPPLVCSQGRTNHPEAPSWQEASGSTCGGHDRSHHKAASFRHHLCDGRSCTLHGGLIWTKPLTSPGWTDGGRPGRGWWLIVGILPSVPWGSSAEPSHFHHLQAREHHRIRISSEIKYNIAAWENSPVSSESSSLLGFFTAFFGAFFGGFFWGSPTWVPAHQYMMMPLDFRDGNLGAGASIATFVNNAIYREEPADTCHPPYEQSASRPEPCL